MRNVEKAAIFVAIQTKRSPCLWGPPGQGKSSVISDSGRKLGYGVHSIRVNTVLPHYLTGFAVPDIEGRCIRMLAPEWAHELNKHEKSLLFLDDISCGSPTQQTAAFQLFDERTIGDLKLNAIPIAAANPNSFATARFDLDAAVANRMIHISITDDVDTFREDALAHFPAPQVPVVRPNWSELIDRKCDMTTKFLCSSEGAGMLSAQPEQINEKTVAWPSKRSWHAFWEIWAATDSIEPETLKGVDIRELRSLLLAGCVGIGAYRKFLNYFLKPVQAQADAALRKGSQFSFPEKGDEMFGLLEAIASKLHGYERLKKHFDQGWAVAEEAWETSHRDRVVPFILDLLSIYEGQFDPPRFYEKTVRPILQVAH